MCDLIFLTSFEIPVIVCNEFENKSYIQGYHPYMNNWKPIIGENLQTHAEAEDILDKYVAAVLKDT